MIRFTGRGVLLDIEGTTSSISFVHDVMFPYVRQHLAHFLDERWQTQELESVRQQLAHDDGAANWSAWLAARSASAQSAARAFQARIIELMEGDVKATGLKSLQGLIWESGFHSGQLQSHVYPDALPAIESWKKSGLDVRIYSSGSIAAQKLFFGHVAQRGDCLHLFSGHYDTTIGGKRDANSYARIAADWGVEPPAILFLSDLAPELEAATAAGLQVAASIRPGNAALPDAAPWPRLQSFAEVKVAGVSRS